MNRQKKKVVVALSGGVDSSMAAYLLKQSGHEITGLFMRLGVEQEKSEASARAVCQKLAIRFYPVNLSQKFRQEVIDYFLNSYAHGLTPNPCVKCNQVIKFNELLRLTHELEAGYLATGHYVRNAKCKMQNVKLVYQLFRGIDGIKDQSYFLYNLTQRQLAHILFPLGEYTKEQVKKLADKQKLPYLARESQDICFIKKHGQIIDHNEFLKKHLKLKPGPVKTLDGQKVGEHQGLPLYTIGQRKGVEIGGIGPFYVVRADFTANTLYVVKNNNDPALFSDKLIAKEVNWISGQEPKMPLKCKAVIRYRHKPVNCLITKTSDVFKRYRISNQVYLVKFNKPLRAITPGQSVVFYKIRCGTIPPLARSGTAYTNENKEHEVLGGGIIKQSKM